MKIRMSRKKKLPSEPPWHRRVLLKFVACPAYCKNLLVARLEAAGQCLGLLRLVSVAEDVEDVELGRSGTTRREKQRARREWRRFLRRGNQDV